jgi:hypothetical protein
MKAGMFPLLRVWELHEEEVMSLRDGVSTLPCSDLL